jgi:hypothetical protein
MRHATHEVLKNELRTKREGMAELEEKRLWAKRLLVRILDQPCKRERERERERD